MGAEGELRIWETAIHSTDIPGAPRSMCQALCQALGDTAENRRARLLGVQRVRPSSSTSALIKAGSSFLPAA